MSKKIILPTSLSTLMLAISAQLALAENGYYGISVGQAEYSDSHFSDNASLIAIYARIGTHVNSYVSAEVRAGTNLGDGTIEVLGFGADIDIELESLYGVYLRGGFDAGGFYPYLVIGYTEVKINGESPIESFSSSDDDISYGLGFDVDLGNSITGNLKYMSYTDGDGIQINGLSAGIVKRF